MSPTDQETFAHHLRTSEDGKGTDRVGWGDRGASPAASAEPQTANSRGFDVPVAICRTAGGGSRTHTEETLRRILSPLRLPFRHAGTVPGRIVPDRDLSRQMASDSALRRVCRICERFLLSRNFEVTLRRLQGSFPKNGGTWRPSPLFNCFLRQFEGKVRPAPKSQGTAARLCVGNAARSDRGPMIDEGSGNALGRERSGQGTPSVAT